MSTTARTKASAAAPASANDTHDEDEDEAPPTYTEWPSIAHALMGAQRAIRHGVTKANVADIETRTGGKFGYNFASGEDMIAACSAALLANGLLWTLESYTVDDGGEPTLFEPVYLLEHPDSNAVTGTGLERRYAFSIPISMSGAADKALAGARTYGNSYALRDVLQVPRPDPNEPDKRKSDEGAGSWRTRSKTKREDDAPSGPSPERNGQAANPRKVASDALMVEWRHYQAAQRAKGVEPVFAQVYREAFGRKWPGSDKAPIDDILKFGVELKRLALLDDESAAADADHDDEGDGELFGKASPGDKVLDDDAAWGKS